MKATCNREGLSTAFQAVAAVVPARTPKPILKSVKLMLMDDGQAILMATDLELGVRYRVSGVEVSQPGEVVLPCQLVLPILRELQDETIRLEASGMGIQVIGGTSKFELVAEDPLQYPAVPAFGEAPGYRIKGGELAKLIRRTIFAAATENTRYALNSVMIEFEGSKLSLVATDGRRLALMSGSVEGEGPPPAGTTLLPPKTVAFLQKVLHDPEEGVDIVARENEVHFRTPKVTVYSRLVEGRFPKYQEVFPREIQHRIPLSVTSLYGAVRQARIVTNEDSKGVVFRFHDGNVTMESRSAEFGQSEVTMPVNYSGPELAVTYDPDFLIDALRVLEPERELTLEIVDGKRASVLRSEDGFAYVIMPLTKER